MMATAVPVSPVALPANWALEYDSMGNVVLRAGDPAGGALGYATIDERLRAFALGMCQPRVESRGHPEYQGRGWRARLYFAAVETLGEAVLPLRKA